MPYVKCKGKCLFFFFFRHDKISGTFRLLSAFATILPFRALEKLWFAPFPPTPLIVLTNPEVIFFFYFVLSSLKGSRYRGVVFHPLRRWNNVLAVGWHPLRSFITSWWNFVLHVADWTRNNLLQPENLSFEVCGNFVVFESVGIIFTMIFADKYQYKCTRRYYSSPSSRRK